MCEVFAFDDKHLNELIYSIIENIFVYGFCVIVKDTHMILPVEFTTLITKKSEVMTGSIEKVILNEATNNETVFEKDEVVIVRHRHLTHRFVDILGRQTYGVYGQSTIQKVQTRVQWYISILKAYVEFVQRYGYGRLLISSDAVAKLIEQGNYDEAATIFQTIVEKQKMIAPNQDIIGAGMHIEQLETNTGLDIVQIKESFEKDIAAMMLSSAYATGKESGTTYASAKIVSEEKEKQFSQYRSLIEYALQELDIEYTIREKKDIFTVDELTKLVQHGIITENEAREKLKFEYLS